MDADILMYSRKDVDSQYVVAAPYSRVQFTVVAVADTAHALHVCLARPKPPACATVNDCRSCSLKVSIRCYGTSSRYGCYVPLTCTESWDYAVYTVPLEEGIACPFDIWFENPYPKQLLACQLQDSLYLKWFMFSTDAVDAHALPVNRHSNPGFARIANSRLSVRAQQGGLLSVGLYSPSGQLVQVLHNGPFEGGTRELVLRADAGARLAPAAYIVVVRLGRCRESLLWVSCSE
jgi:hypothetical protein